MKEVEIKMAPEDIGDQSFIKEEIGKAAKIQPKEIFDFKVVRRSIDGRYRPPIFLVKAEVYTNEPLPPVVRELDDLPDVSSA
ncbi:MAG: hypothetical protein ABIQ11_00710, partial [Saprospiraceae bacterium]